MIWSVSSLVHGLLALRWHSHLLLHHRLLLLWLLHHGCIRVVAVHDLLLLRLNRHSLKWVHILGVHKVVFNDVVIHRWKASCLKEVLG